MSVWYNDVQKGQYINSQECKSFEIDAVTGIKKSLIEYHHWINGMPHHFIITQ